MDRLHQFLATPEVLQASADRRYGWLVRAVRQARDETLVQVAARCHLDPSAMSRIERGERRLTDIDLLRSLAAALEIPPQLFGLAPAVSGAAQQPACSRAVSVYGAAVGGQDGDEAMRRRRFLAGLAGIATAGMVPNSAAAATSDGSLEALLLAQTRLAAEPLSLPALRRVLDSAYVAFDNCEYSTLMSSLPNIIASAHTSCTEGAGALVYEQLSGQLARAYLLASKLAIKNNGNTIAAITADRALTAARHSGDAITVAASSRQVAIAMRRDALNAKDAAERSAGLDGAVRVLTSTALDLGADHGNPDAPTLATYGALLCTASYSAAQNGKTAQAVGLIEEAEHAAQRLSAAGTAQFSPTTVAVYRIGVHTALGDAASAVTCAESVIPGQLLTSERRARFRVDTARAWVQYGDNSKASEALSPFAHAAPDELRRPSVRQLIAHMLEAPGPTPNGLKLLAARALA